jgi:hypothetical protein
MKPLTRRFSLALLLAAAFGLSSCGGGGGGASSSSSGASCSNPPGLATTFGNPTGANVVPLTIDQGPTVSGTPVGTIDQAFVTVTICVPGTTNCQTMDHVWIDTGSTGLRIVSSSLTVPLPLSPASATPIGSCGQFVSTYTWGALRTADIHIGSETALNVPVQAIGDTQVPSTAPSTCSSAGTAMATVTDLGANALLGIGLFLQDCGLTCVSSAQSGFYYSCPSTATTCGPTTMPLNDQLQNVVGLFPTDNNGSLIQIPVVPPQGQATAGGWLVFGINTQTNNQLGNALVFQADPAFGVINTNTTYGTTSNTGSFIDSGSNGWFFNDPTLSPCASPNQSWFCATAQLAATLTTCVTTDCAGFPTVSHTYDFCVAHFNDLLNANPSFAAFTDIGGPGTTTPGQAGTSFDWGLPFFFGRSVFTAVEGKTINGTNGPFFAASTP